MFKRKTYVIVAVIFVLAIVAGILDYPKYFNRSLGEFGFPKFPEVPFKLGLDLQGGTHLVYEADLSNIEKADYQSSMQGLRDVIERRVNLFGVQEPVVQTQQAGDDYRLIVELAGIKDPAQAIKEIGKTPFLQFKEQKENYEEIMKKNRQLAEAGKETEMEDPFQDTQLTGKYLEKAELDFDQTTYKPLIRLQFNDEGAKIFEELTKENIQKPLAIYIDGVPISVPVVQDVISGGKAQITGNFTIEEAKKLARDLNAGALPVPINLISQQSVGPTLGAISLQKSLWAAIWGLLAVVIFMIMFYRLPGFLASIALAIYVVLVLALFKLIPVTLTLAGIGGFILSVGMAIDANILIFSRMREELKEGKSFSMAVEEGFRRAWPSIRDGNFTTLIVALVLFGFGTSFVKGFAFTLTIGILMSMFSAIVITKSLLRAFVGTKLEKIKILWR
ncbi:MAG: protein translocase subunit SecD [Candidatus Nealsonbacteria bacterium]|nr:MAG: protein translocase subunit SecD [Candidatus Nealsonbacteria bacterium]